MKWCFVVFFLLVLSLFFREQRVPVDWVENLCGRLASTNFVIHVDNVSFGFRRGITAKGVRIYDTTRKDPLVVFLSADELAVNFITRKVFVEGLKFPRLSDSYYAPGNTSRNARVEATFPDIPPFTLCLERPDILGIAPAYVIASPVYVTPSAVNAPSIRLTWPDKDERMTVKGELRLDLETQEVTGEIDGLARQSHIRPLLEALDVPVSLPYFDGFTEVPKPVPSRCGWKVNLINNDFDLYLHLRPTLGRYNSIPMKCADGRIHLHVYTRDDCLNYHQTIGPIHAIGLQDQPLDGTIVIDGTNNYNTIDVEAKSSLPVANILRIGGFTGDYVNDDVIGTSTGRLQFRFPRAMTNNYEQLNGFGHLEIKDGRLMRLKGFKGLLDAMPKIAPAVSWLSDSTQASCDYVIENGILKTDNIYIEGTVFSIKMYGLFDIVRNALDFTVRVQFTKKDSLMGIVLHPLTWPFTKLLLEFKLAGTPDKPEWNYITVVDRVMEVLK